MTRFVDAAGEQLQGLRQQMQQLGRKAKPASDGENGGMLANLSYGAIAAEVVPLLGPVVDRLLSRFRPAAAPEVRAPEPVRGTRVFTAGRVAGAGAVLVLAGLAYGLGSGKLRINVQARRIQS